MKQVVGVLLIVLLSVSLAIKNEISPINQLSRLEQGNDYECNEEGYLRYLNNWDINIKSSSRDTTSDEFKERVQYYTSDNLW